MKRAKHIGAALGLAAVTLFGGCASVGSHPLENDPHDVAEIETLLRVQTEAWNLGDLHEFVAGYAESPERMTFVGSKGTVVRGRAALEQRYVATYSGDRHGTLTFTDLEIRRLANDTYLVLGKWNLARPPDDPHGVFTLVMQRGEHGIEIVHDHSSGAE